MKEKKKNVVVAKVGGVEITVEGEKDEDVYELTLSKSQAFSPCFGYFEYHIQDRGKDLDNNA